MAIDVFWVQQPSNLYRSQTYVTQNAVLSSSYRSILVCNRFSGILGCALEGYNRVRGTDDVIDIA